MYKGEFKEGRNYETDTGKEITYVGRVNNTHYVVNHYDKDNASAVSDTKLRDCIIREMPISKTLTGYINIYDNYYGDIYRTRSEANDGVVSCRTECVKITIEYKEGQFDE